VPERAAGSFDRGSPVRVRVSNRPDEEFAGFVSFVSPVVDPGSRTLTVKAMIPNPEGRLRAGQFAGVDLVLATHPDAVLLPETAIVPRSGENFVFQVRADTAHRRSVTIGERQEGIVEIRKGVAAGDTIVVAGQQRLRDGAPVRLSYEERTNGRAKEVAAATRAGG
jgi:membrane fusion protein (multidrug efflux system)